MGTMTVPTHMVAVRIEEVNVQSAWCIVSHDCPLYSWKKPPLYFSLPHKSFFFLSYWFLFWFAFWFIEYAPVSLARLPASRIQGLFHLPWCCWHWSFHSIVVFQVAVLRCNWHHESCLSEVYSLIHFDIYIHPWKLHHCQDSEPPRHPYKFPPVLPHLPPWSHHGSAVSID